MKQHKGKNFAPRRLGDIFEQVLRKYSLGKSIKEQKILLLWEEKVGEKISRHTKPVKVVNKKLVVHADNPAWVQELSLMKNEILRKLNCGEEIIKDIKFQVGNITEQLQEKK